MMSCLPSLSSPLPSTTLCCFRVFQSRPARLAAKEEAKKLILDEGMFETGFLSKSDEESRPSPGYGGLIPEDWKHMQKDLHMTKQEKKRQLAMQERENAQLKDIRAQLERQKVGLFSDRGQPSADSGIRGRRQLPGARQLSELEKELSSNVAGRGRPDTQLDEMFTVEEQYRLKRRIPDFHKVHSEKWPILHTLAASGQYFFLDEFLKLGVDASCEDEDGYTPLQRAVLARKQTAVSQLLKAGADVDVHDKDGANLLHLSAQVGSLHLVRLFVRYGLNVNHADKYGWTPLHVAVLTARDDIVRDLILNGGDRSLKNKDGLTPLDIVIALGKEFNSFSVAKALKILQK